MTRPLHTAALLLLLLAGTVAAQESMRVFDLQYRQADEFIPMLETLVGESGSVTGTDGKLVVRADGETLSQVAEVIAELDTPPVPLIISVRQSDQRTGGGTGGSVSTRSDERESGRVRGRVRVYRNRSGDESTSTQRLRLLDGHWASLRVGQEVPVGERRTLRSGDAVAVEEGVSWKDATRGIDVRARLSGERVMVDLMPHSRRMSREGGGRMDVREAATTISAPLGEWITVGGSSDDRWEDGSGITWSTKSAEQNTFTIQLKVERADESP